MKRTDIYPVSIFQSSVADNSRLKEIMVPTIEDAKEHKDNQAPDVWFTDNLKTSWDNKHPSNNILFGDNNTGNEVMSAYFDVLKTFPILDTCRLEIAWIWWNYYSNGEYQDAHNHLSHILNPVHYSCVHFLSYDPSIHAPLLFSDPIYPLRTQTLEFGSKGYNDTFAMDVQEGDVLLFPCYLQHEVRPSEATPEYPRITVSWNIKITDSELMPHDW